MQSLDFFFVKMTQEEIVKSSTGRKPMFRPFYDTVFLVARREELGREPGELALKVELKTKVIEVEL